MAARSRSSSCSGAVWQTNKNHRALKCHAVSVTVTHFALLSTLPSHIVFLTRKKPRLYLIFIWKCIGPHRSHYAGIKHVFPGFLSRASHLSANQKRKGLHNSQSENCTIVSGYDFMQQPMKIKHILGISTLAFLKNLRALESLAWTSTQDKTPFCIALEWI